MGYEGHERRRLPRLAINLPAQLRERGRSAFSVRLLDISALGCRLELYSDLEPGTWIWLKLPGLEPRYSRIAWCRGGFAGVEFEAPLYEAVIDVLVGIERSPTTAEMDDLRAVSERCRAAAARADEEESVRELLCLAADCELGCAGP